MVEYYKSNFLSLLIPFSFLLFTSCKGQSIEYRSAITGFDVSENDSLLIYSLYHKNQSFLKIYNIKNDIDTTILIDAESSIFNPSFFGLESIFYVKKYYNKNQNIIMNYAVEIIDLKSKNKWSYELPKGIVSSVIFSRNNKKFFFLSASEFGHNSPLGVDAPHGFDIYSLSIDDKKVEQLSNFNKYGLYELIEIDSLNFAMVDVPHGMVIYNMKRKNKLQPLKPKLSKYVKEKSMFDDPTFIPRFFNEKTQTLYFSSPYIIYKMNISDKKGIDIAKNNSHLEEIKLLISSNEIVFTLKGDPLKFNFHNGDTVYKTIDVSKFLNH